MSSELKAEPAEPVIRCPGCAALARSGIRAYCPRCGICLTGPHAAELLYISTALAGGRRWLIQRRGVLLADLWRQRDEAIATARSAHAGQEAAAPATSAEPPAPETAAMAPVSPVGAVPAQAASDPPALAWSAESSRVQPFPAGPSAAGAGPARRREMSARTAANLLLAVGGLLVVVAAAAFTTANWGSIGTAGRAAILLGLAVAALAAPWPLARRGLAATAESFAGIGLALTVADTYLARNLVTRGSGVSLGLAAAACAALAVAWAVYGSVAPAKGPRLAAGLIAQLPVPLAVAAVAPARGAVPLALIALALLATTCGDLIMASWAGRRQLRAERLTARAAAVVTWLGGIGLASIGAAIGPAVGGSFLLSAVFILAAVIGLRSSAGQADAGLVPEGLVPEGLVPEGLVPARPALGELVWGIAGMLIAVGLALPAAAEVPNRWTVGVFAITGAVVAAAAQSLARRRHDVAERLAGQAGYLTAGGLAVLGGAGLWVAPAALAALFAPLAELGRIWAGTPGAGPAGQLTDVGWNGPPVMMVAPAVLMLAGLACWLAPVPRRSQAQRSGPRSAALALAALAGAAVPVAARLPVWAALVMLTVIAAALLGVGSSQADRLLAGTACWAGLALAACAAGWSLIGPGATIAEFAVLAVIFAAAAWLARAKLATVLATAGAVAASTGLASAVPLAIGSGSAQRGEPAAAFCVLGVAIAAIGVATLLRRARPLQGRVLDLSAVPVVLAAAAMVAQRAGSFSALAAAAALLAASTAWLRTGHRRDVALGGAVVASVAAVVPQLKVLADAVVLPYREMAGPWQGMTAGQPAASHLAGLPLAMVVLAACAGAIVIAAGAWRGSQASLNVLAVAAPLIAAPAGAAFGLSYSAAAGLLLAITLAMTTWAAASRSLVPAGAALAVAWPTLSWALAGPAITLTVLGCLAVGYSFCAWRGRLARVRVGAAAAAVVAAGALAGSSVLAAGLAGWLAGLAVLTAAGGAQLVATVLARASSPSPDAVPRPDAGPRPDARPSPDASPRADARPRLLVSLAIESAGWLAAVVGVVPSLTGRQGHASIALAAAAALCLGVALRPGRRPLLWGGLALGETALCVWLAASGVRAPEPYTAPAAIIVIAFGWQRSRRSPGARSWATYGPGLVLLLMPSLAAAWPDHGWVRPLLLGLVAAGVTLAGGRARLQAPLLLGAVVTVLDAGRQLAPAIARLAGLLPRWVPVALLGLILLAVGATYEARLKNLGKLRAALGRLR